MMTDTYLRAVAAHLGRLSAVDRRRALSSLSSQVDELVDAGIDPESALGDPASYADGLLAALMEEPAPHDAQWQVLGLPVETRGPVSAEVRSRTWDPMSTRVIVPRLFGIGWTVNLGALAVRAGLIRPDEAGEDVLDHVPPATSRAAQVVPAVLAGATAAALALAWRGLPPRVASGFDLTGRPRGQASRRTLVPAVALGVVPALWAQRRGEVEERLVRSASATSLAVISAGVVAATVAQAHRPGGRWGLLLAAAVPASVAASLAVVVVPVRAGLRHAWGDTAAARPLDPSAEEVR
jgi:hypothetical protein